MPIATRLSDYDLHAVIEVVATAASLQNFEPFELPVIERLLELIPADRAEYFELELPDCAVLRMVAQPTEGDSPQISWDMDDADWSDYPLADSRRLDERGPLRLSDFVSQRQLERTSFYADGLRPSGINHELRVWLPSTGNPYCFAFQRGRGRDFDERDRTVLTVLRPHLSALRNRWDRRRRPAPLTAREAEVLELVAHGMTNKEIARRLVVSTGTVRTHLENIFEKLGVHTRTAAAAFRRAA